MPMNIVIQEQRKLLGLTQEQVADYLGVSTPAVSKWEKGITSPDIGLLPPLARLLKIDLNTLFCFSEDLSEQEIGFFCNELAKQARNDILSAFDAAEAKIHEYPHNELLLLNITIILDSILLQTADDTLPIDSLDTKISDWYLHLAESNDEKIRNSANYMRVNRYIRKGKTDAAQEVLDTIQDKTDLISTLPDKLMLQVSIYMQQQKAELAALELEKALFKEITRVQMLLTKLIDAELASGNTESACKIAEKSSSMVDVFDMWEYNRYIASYQILEQKQNADATLHLLEQMLEALTTHWSLTDSVLYHRMAPETKAIQSHELIPVLLNGLETDPQCAYLREHPKFREIIDKYKNKWGIRLLLPFGSNSRVFNYRSYSFFFCFFGCGVSCFGIFSCSLIERFFF